MEVITLLAGSKYVVIDGNLHVRDTQLEDTRLTYRCYAKHRLDDQQQAVSSPTRIRLEPGDGVPSAPRLVPPTLTLLHARAGQPAYLACGTYANPAPKIRYLIHSWLSSIVVSLLIVDSLAPNPRSQSSLRDSLDVEGDRQIESLNWNLITSSMDWSQYQYLITSPNWFAFILLTDGWVWICAVAALFIEPTIESNLIGHEKSFNHKRCPIDSKSFVSATAIIVELDGFSFLFVRNEDWPSDKMVLKCWCCFNSRIDNR